MIRCGEEIVIAPSVERTVTDMTHRLGRQPSVADIAEELDVEVEDVLEAMQAASAYRSTSLQAPRGPDDEGSGATLGDSIGRAEEGFHRAEQRAVLSDLLRGLTLRERTVVLLRFEHDLTQAEIGERIGVSQMQVSRILRTSLARLHEIARTRP